jgi:hypothetical protein
MNFWKLWKQQQNKQPKKPVVLMLTIAYT